MNGTRILLAAILATLFVPEVTGPNPLDEPLPALGYALAWLISFVTWLALAAFGGRATPKEDA